MPKYSNGVAWRGPSPYDGTPIALVVNGVRGCGYSDNRKTTGGSKRLGLDGPRAKEVEPLAQSFILVDNGLTALENIRAGTDCAICGDCPHRGTILPSGKMLGRTCYVPVYKAVQTVSKKLLGIPIREGTQGEPYGDFIQAPGQGIRLGTYGDPGMIPIEVLAELCRVAGHWTGYTHLWHRLDPEVYGQYLMASVDSREEAQLAMELGWRTFWIVPLGESIPKRLGTRRVLACPAAKEQGARTSCSACGICSGSKGKGRISVGINAHGTQAKSFVPTTDLPDLGDPLWV